MLETVPCRRPNAVFSRYCPWNVRIVNTCDMSAATKLLDPTSAPKSRRTRPRAPGVDVPSEDLVASAEVAIRELAVAGARADKHGLTKFLDCVEVPLIELGADLEAQGVNFAPHEMTCIRGAVNAELTR